MWTTEPRTNAWSVLPIGLLPHTMVCTGPPLVCESSAFATDAMTSHALSIIGHDLLFYYHKLQLVITGNYGSVIMTENPR